MGPGLCHLAMQGSMLWVRCVLYFYIPPLSAFWGRSYEYFVVE